MIKFYVLTDDLLYKNQVEDIINRVIDNNYVIKNNIDFINNGLNNIYIVDLESINSLEILYQIRKIDSLGKIIILTSKKTMLDVCSYQLKYYKLIDKESNYLLELEDAIISILKSKKSKNLDIKNDSKHLQIPLEEIISIDTHNNKFIINGKKADGRKYTCTMIFKSQKIKNLEEIVLNAKNRNIKLYYSNNNIVIYNEQKKHIVYSDSLKNEIILLFLKGVSVKYLSKKYHVSASTIYLWIKKYRFENKLVELENNNKKYKKIEQIVNSK